MSHSNSSLNCFADCMAKYEHRYILKTPTNKPPSEHLTFGSMAHEVLHKAGVLRDDAADGVVEKGDYNPVIPSEVLYGDLKMFFGITSWERYFHTVIKETALLEQQLIKELTELSGLEPLIEREVRVQLPPQTVAKFGYKVNQPIVGVIDLLLYTPTHAIIIDFKFSTKVKGQDVFDMDSQLPLYSAFANLVYDIPLHNIQYGYIDIPKVEFGKPTVLTNGTLSRAKGQNCSQEGYRKAAEAIHRSHGDWCESMFEPGGYYYDCYVGLAFNKPAYLTKQWLDLSVYEGVIPDLMDTAVMIDFMIEHKKPFLKKYSTYACKGCDYIEACKPWLAVWLKEV